MSTLSNEINNNSRFGFLLIYFYELLILETLP